MQHYRLLSLAFFLGLIPTLLMPVIWPSLRLFFFAPFLAIVISKSRFLPSLWLALLSGLCVDVLSSATPFGFHSLAYTLTTAALYGQRHRFLPDNIAAIPLFSFFLSITVTIVQRLLLSFFDIPLPLSWGWVGADLILLPLADAAYAAVGYLLPLALLLRGRYLRPVRSHPLRRPR